MQSLRIITFFAIAPILISCSTDSSAKIRKKISEHPITFNGLSDFGKNNATVFKNESPKVVFVHNLRHVVRAFSFNTMEYQQGTGSGFIWDNDGHIVTNFHVINGADDIAVTLKDGKKYSAKIVGAEPRKDIAVLKIKLPKKFDRTFHESLADSKSIIVGQKAIAIGNPFGLNQTLTVGSISAIGRTTQAFLGVTIRDMIQTDAAINPGNSGGPLLDHRGYLLGMNTAIASASGSSAGVGFAVPSNTINRVVTQIINHGKVIQPGFGFEPLRLGRSYMRYLGVKGVVVGQILPNTPAQKKLRGTRRNRLGELVLGDIITAINDTKIDSYDDLYNALESKKPGDKVKIKVVRDNKEKEIDIELTRL